MKVLFSKKGVLLKKLTFSPKAGRGVPEICEYAFNSVTNVPVHNLFN